MSFRKRVHGVTLATVAAVVGLLGPPHRNAEPAPLDSWTIRDGIVVRSFDDTPIATTLMLPEGASPAHPVPVLLNGHGFGADAERTHLPGDMLQVLLEEGFAIMTWDARGYGESGGLSHMDSPSFEVKDVQALIDYLATRPEILRDAPGDPRLGFIGGSYGGTIQLNTAAFDPRIEALVPQHVAGDMADDITPNDVFKERWDLPLLGTTRFAPEVYKTDAQLDSTGVMSPASKIWYEEKDTTRYSSRIRTPTLLIQGTIDSLFPLQNGIANFENIEASGTPVKLIAYCEGHTGCPYPGGASGYPKGAAGRQDVWADRLLAWLDRYVKGRPVATGPAFEWQSQYGHYVGASSYPVPGTRSVRTEPAAFELKGPGSSGGDTLSGGLPAPASEINEGTAARTTIHGPVIKDTAIVGLPKLHITGSAQGPGQPIAFFELIEVARDGTERTIDRQVTPLRLQPGPVKENVQLNAVAWLLRPGHSVALEVTTGSAIFSKYGEARYALNLQVTTRLPMAPP